MMMKPLKWILLLSMLPACQSMQDQAVVSQSPSRILAKATDPVEQDWLVIADIYRQLPESDVQAEQRFLQGRLNKKVLVQESQLRLGMLLSLHAKSQKEFSQARRLLRRALDANETPANVKRIVSLLLAQTDQSYELMKMLSESERRSEELVQKLQAVSSIEKKLEERTRE